MIITGVKRSNETITIYTNQEIISFESYKTDTPYRIVNEMMEEGFKISNLGYLLKLLKIVLYTRFKSIL